MQREQNGGLNIWLDRALAENLVCYISQKLTAVGCQNQLAAFCVGR